MFAHETIEQFAFKNELLTVRSVSHSLRSKVLFVSQTYSK